MGKLNYMKARGSIIWAILALGVGLINHLCWRLSVLFSIPVDNWLMFWALLGYITFGLNMLNYYEEISK